MKREEKLYEVLGELLYAVAMADGVIQAEEKNALHNFFSNHAMGEDVIWSFEYEETKKPPVDSIYTKVIDYCHSYGPSPIYVEFMDAMQVIAKAANGIDESESKILNSFSVDLLARFQRDADKLLNRDEDE